MNFLGTNDHPGDYRSSGCTGCHVVYANDRSVVHSSPVWAEFGNRGTTATGDEQYANKKDEPGHPVKHQFTNQIPTSQCMVCHMHPGTNMVSTYTGFMWWDNETDAKAAGMYPEKQRNISMDEEYTKLERNPEGASVRGNWSDPDFLQKTGSPEFNSKLKRTQFADFHGHGWLFRAVFKKDKEGNFLDVNNAKVENVDAAKMREAVEYRDMDNDPATGPKAGAPVHLKDIHLEKGMHCIDCHFRQDSHGNGILYNGAARRGRDRLHRLPRHRHQARHARHLRLRRRPQRDRPRRRAGDQRRRLQERRGPQHDERPRAEDALHAHERRTPGADPRLPEDHRRRRARRR